MRRFTAVVALAAVLAFAGILARGSSPQGQVAAFDCVNFSVTYQYHNTTVWNSYYNEYTTASFYLYRYRSPSCIYFESEIWMADTTPVYQQVAAIRAWASDGSQVVNVQGCQTSFISNGHYYGCESFSSTITDYGNGVYSVDNYNSYMRSYYVSTNPMSNYVHASGW